MTDRNIPCPVCGHPTTHSLFMKDGYAIRRCLGCSIVFSDGRDRFDERQIYTEDYFQNPHVKHGYSDYRALWPAQRKTATMRLNRLNKFQLPGRSLLDVGCGTGVFLATAAERGWDCKGIELSPYASAFGREHYGLDIQTGSLTNDSFLAGSFSLITLWDVIEHLRDPLETLHVCRHLLQSGGMIALSTGNVGSLCARLTGVKWHLYTVPEHIFFFSPSTITTLLTSASFEVVSIAHPMAYYPVSYVIERLDKTLAMGATNPRKIRIPKPLGDCVLPVNLLDIMQVIARAM